MPPGWRKLCEFPEPPSADSARGIFETVLVLDGRPVEWARHRERLRSSMRELYGVEIDAGADRLAAELAADQPLARLRIDAVPAAAGTIEIAGQVSAVEPEAVLAVAAPSLAPVRVAAGFGPHKLADRGWIERIESSLDAGARALLVTRAEIVLETTRGNVLALCGRTVHTPPLDGAILPGIMRAVVLDAARAMGLEVREAPLTLAQLRAADAVLLTNSLRLLECRIQGGQLRAIGELRHAVADVVGWRGERTVALATVEGDDERASS